MELGTVIKWRVIVAFALFLLVISVYAPYVGIPLAVVWLAIVIIQYRRQQQDQAN